MFSTSIDTRHGYNDSQGPGWPALRSCYALPVIVKSIFNVQGETRGNEIWNPDLGVRFANLGSYQVRHSDEPAETPTAESSSKVAGMKIRYYHSDTLKDYIKLSQADRDLIYVLNKEPREFKSTEDAGRWIIITTKEQLRQGSSYAPS